MNPIFIKQPLHPSSTLAAFVFDQWRQFEKEKFMIVGIFCDGE